MFSNAVCDGAGEATLSSDSGRTSTGDRYRMGLLGWIGFGGGGEDSRQSDRMAPIQGEDAWRPVRSPLVPMLLACNMHGCTRVLTLTVLLRTAGHTDGPAQGQGA